MGCAASAATKTAASTAEWDVDNVQAPPANANNIQGGEPPRVPWRPVPSSSSCTPATAWVPDSAPTVAAGTAVTSNALRALLARDDKGLLREAFEEHADGKDGAGEPAMSKDALLRALDALLVRRDEEEVDELIARINLNGSGSIDFQQFQQEVRSRSRLEMLLHGLPLLRILADMLGGNTDAYTKTQDCEVEAKVLSAVPVLVDVIKHNLRSLRASDAAVGAAAAHANSEKFSFTIQGGDLQDFHKGLAGRVGEPHADIEVGMEKEHLKALDADEPFKTSNYGIITTPRKEYELVLSGGKGLTPGDERKFRPLDEYDELDMVKDRRVGRPEVIAVILYTGPMFQVSLSIVTPAIVVTSIIAPVIVASTIVDPIVAIVAPSIVDPVFAIVATADLVPSVNCCYCYYCYCCFCNDCCSCHSCFCNC